MNDFIYVVIYYDEITQQHKIYGFSHDLNVCKTIMKSTNKELSLHRAELNKTLDIFLDELEEIKVYNYA